ncbi:MAG: hypothetical protein KIT56_03455 [Gammaproteobacteria bacterium]|nr:hypothetical protein [Gammaproteobacteria bacterium]MCW5582934.1 hypothetical protein [Gammaproteobacteria bacterium]
MFLRENTPQSNELRNSLNQLPSTNILVCSYNVGDGVGDFRNAIDAYCAMQLVAEQHKIKLISLVTKNKLEAVLKIKQYNLPNETHCVVDLTQANGGSNTIEESNIILICVSSDDQIQAENRDSIKKNIQLPERIRTFLEETYLVINIATPIRYMDFLLDSLPKNCFIKSILEYSSTMPEQNKTIFSSKNIQETSMGILPHQAGLKLNADLYTRSSNHEKIDVLLSLQRLPEIMCLTDKTTKIDKQMASDYFSNKLLAVGYTQGLYGNLLFSYVLSGLAKNKKIQHIDVIGSADLSVIYKRFYENTDFKIIYYPNHYRFHFLSKMPDKIDDSYKDSYIIVKDPSYFELSSTGEAKIFRVKKYGEHEEIKIHDQDEFRKLLKETMKDSEMDSSKNNLALTVEQTNKLLAITTGQIFPIETVCGKGDKTLRIIPLAGTSNQDLEKLMLAADCVAGSGDNSMSDMLSSKKFPFVSILRHKHTFIAELTDLMRKEGLIILADYFSLLSVVGKETDVILGHALNNPDLMILGGTKLMLFVEKHALTIEKEIALFSDILYNKYNVEQYFVSMLHEFVQEQNKDQSLNMSSTLGFFKKTDDESNTVKSNTKPDDETTNPKQTL